MSEVLDRAPMNLRQVEPLSVNEETVTDLVCFGFSNEGMYLELSGLFGEVLAKVSSLAEESTALLANADIDTIDEEQLSRITKEMKPVKEYNKSIENTLKDIRSNMNNARDEISQYLTGLLNQADYDVLIENETKLKALNKQMLARRKENNWQMVRDEFNNTVAQYPELDQSYPDLLSTDWFEHQNPKLVSGAKSWKMNDTVVHTIKDYINRVNTNHLLIKEMDSPAPNQLVMEYNKTGNMDAVVALNDKLKIQQAEAEQRQKEIIEELARKKQAEYQQALLAKQQAEAQATAQQQTTPQPPMSNNAVVQPFMTSQPNPVPANAANVAPAPFGMQNINPVQQQVQATQQVQTLATNDLTAPSDVLLGDKALYRQMVYDIAKVMNLGYLINKFEQSETSFTHNEALNFIASITNVMYGPRTPIVEQMIELLPTAQDTLNLFNYIIHQTL